MVVQEPSGTLWDAVRATGVSWPESNEDVVARIADEWDRASNTFESAGRYPISDVANFWPDDAGKAFVSRTRADLDAAADLATTMSTLAGNARFFVGEVTQAKQHICDLIAYYQVLFALTFTLPGIGVQAFMAQRIVNLAAQQVSQVISDAIGRIRGQAAVHPVTVPIHMPSQVPIPGTSPTDVKKWWDGLSQAEQDGILRQNPDAIRNLDGIPAAVRDRANRLVLPREIAALRAREKQLQDLADAQSIGSVRMPETSVETELKAVQKRIASLEELRKGGIHTEIGELEKQEAAIRNDPFLSETVRAAQLAAVQDRLVNARGFRDQHQPRGDQMDEPNRPPTLLLALHAADDGKAVVSVGDPDKARNVATWVPGMANDLDRIHDPDDGGLLGRTERLYDAAARAGSESTAVVMWLGYDTPDGAGDAMEGSYADAGKQALADFQEGLRATQEGPNSHNTVIGHSYGAVTIGHAARDIGLNADDVVLVAGPGTGAEHVSELRLLRPDGDAYTPDETADRVHPTVAADDPIQWLNGDHGPVPTSDEFGAGDNTFYTRPGDYIIDSHSVAFDSDNPALDTMGQIIAGTRPRR